MPYVGGPTSKEALCWCTLVGENLDVVFALNIKCPISNGCLLYVVRESDYLLVFG